MVEIKSKLKVPKAAYRIEVSGRVQLQADAHGHVQSRLEGGEEVRFALPAGESLRNGDLVTASDGRVLEIVLPEGQMLQIEGCGHDHGHGEHCDHPHHHHSHDEHR